MWYLAEILFAEPKEDDRRDFHCEACNVVFQAADASQAYLKAVNWGEAYAAEPPSVARLLGVSHLTTVGEELGDGVEICGRFFEARDVWDPTSDLIPAPEKLKAIQWEKGRDTPLIDLFES